MASFDTFPQISPQHAQKWTKFLKNHNFNELWLWQYWRNESRPQSQLNKKLFNRFSSKIRAQKEIKELIRNGIPPDHRGAIWWVCSGGGEKMKSAASSTAKPMSYSEYLQLALENSPATQDIMKDLHRTFVSVTGDMNEEGMIPLKNVLLAYSVRNRVVGYCQSMNFITAMLLMHLTEEQAFWVLAALIEDILPSDYYTTSMLGCKMDQAVFQSCLAWKLPKLFAHFKAHEMILEPITCSWFLCLYINTLPLPEVLRVWDCVLWEGNVVLFRVGLAICKLMEPLILECQDFPSMFSLLKKPLVDVHFSGTELIEAAFDKSWLGSLPRAKMEQLREAHKQMIIRESEEINRIRRQRALNAAKNENSLSGSLDDESIQDQDVSQAGAGTDHRRISSTYEGAEELLQRVLNDEVIQAQLSLEDTGDLALLVQADNGDDAKESTFEAEEPHLEPPESPMPEYQPPARRTSRIMMSLLTVDGDVSLTIPTPS